MVMLVVLGNSKKPLISTVLLSPLTQMPKLAMEAVGR